MPWLLRAAFAGGVAAVGYVLSRQIFVRLADETESGRRSHRLRDRIQFASRFDRLGDRIQFCPRSYAAVREELRRARERGDGPRRVEGRLDRGTEFEPLSDPQKKPRQRRGEG